MRIFVYGTLKRGHYNHRLMDMVGAEFIGEAESVEPYLLMVERIPYAIRPSALPEGSPEGTPIKGEVYEVEDNYVQYIDSLESHPQWYRRERANFKLSDGSIVNAWIYLAPDSEYRPHEQTGPITDYNQQSIN